MSSNKPLIIGAISVVSIIMVIMLIAVLFNPTPAPQLPKASYVLPPNATSATMPSVSGVPSSSGVPAVSGVPSSSDMPSTNADGTPTGCTKCGAGYYTCPSELVDAPGQYYDKTQSVLSSYRLAAYDPVDPTVTVAGKKYYFRQQGVCP